jgi:hypothetical protein
MERLIRYKLSTTIFAFLAALSGVAVVLVYLFLGLGN